MRPRVDAQIASCSEEVLASKRLQRAFEIVLELGNALNEGTSRGAASGFALSSLCKLMDTRGQGGSTLMHYLCTVRRRLKTRPIVTRASLESGAGKPSAFA
jgi:hypothetical protein